MLELRLKALVLGLGGIAIAALCLLAALAVGVFPASGGSTEIELQGLPPDALDGWGRLLRPDQKDASLSHNDAVAIAKGSRNSEAAVIETVLVRVFNENADPPVDQLAWAVNFDPATVEAVPPSGPEGRPHIPTCGVHPLFHLVLVDASSGQVIYEIQRTTSTNAQSVGDCPNDTDPSPTKVPDASSP